MPEDLDLLAEIADLSPEQERIAAVLADLDRMLPPDRATAAFHPRDCWVYHADCLAARIRRTLTGEDA